MSFISTWSIPAGGTTITLPFQAGTVLPAGYGINWGDGTTTYNNVAPPSHIYTGTGVEMTVAIVIISLSTLPGWSFYAVPNSKDNILSITSFGEVRLGTRAFYLCTNLTHVSEQNIFTPPTDCSFMFYGCTSFNSNLSYWDTSSVTNMSAMFYLCMNFNSNISNWNTSNVTDMLYMFFGCTTFNQSLNWDTSKVVYMTGMFQNCTLFNGNISGWITSDVTLMDSMFYGCTAFTSNLSSWDTSKVTNMRYMFNGCTAFTGNISNWDTSKVTNMRDMFNGCTAFTGNISNWDTSKVTNMRDMFQGCTSLRYDLSKWNVSSISSSSNVPSFTEAYINTVRPKFSTAEYQNAWTFDKTKVRLYALNTIIPSASARSSYDWWEVNDGYRLVAKFVSTWNITAGDTIVLPIVNGDTSTKSVYCRVDWGDGSALQTYNYVVTNNPPQHTYTTTGIKTVTILGTLDAWSYSLVPSVTSSKLLTVDRSRGLTLLAGGFKGCSNLTSFSSEYFTPPVDCTSMFEGCTNFNSNLTTWDMSTVTNIQRMFYGCTIFNGDIVNWNTVLVTNMKDLLYECTAFRRDLSSWRTNGITLDTNVPSFSVEYIDDVKPLFNSAYTQGWRFPLLLNPSAVLPNIIPDDRVSLYQIFDFYLVTKVYIFESTWNVTSGEKIVLPILTGTYINIVVNWNNNVYSTYNGTVNNFNRPSFTYTFSGSVTIFVTGALSGWSFGSVPSSRSKIINIKNYGQLSLANAGNQFLNCDNLEALYDQTGNTLILPYDCSSMFSGCTALTSITEVDLRDARLMNSMFSGCTTFDGNDIVNWNVKNVNDMGNMFNGCTSLSADLSNWVLTGIGAADPTTNADGKVPSFSNDYIQNVNPAFSTNNSAAWNFSQSPNITDRVINTIIPGSYKGLYEILNRRLVFVTNGNTVVEESIPSNGALEGVYEEVTVTFVHVSASLEYNAELRIYYAEDASGTGAIYEYYDLTGDKLSVIHSIVKKPWVKVDLINGSFQQYVTVRTTYDNISAQQFLNIHGDEIAMNTNYTLENIYATRSALTHETASVQLYCGETPLLTDTSGKLIANTYAPLGVTGSVGILGPVSITDPLSTTGTVSIIGQVSIPASVNCNINSGQFLGITGVTKALGTSVLNIDTGQQLSISGPITVTDIVNVSVAKVKVGDYTIGITGSAPCNINAGQFVGLTGTFNDTLSSIYSTLSGSIIPKLSIERSSVSDTFTITPGATVLFIQTITNVNIIGNDRILCYQDDSITSTSNIEIYDSLYNPITVFNPIIKYNQSGVAVGRWWSVNIDIFTSTIRVKVVRDESVTVTAYVNIYYGKPSGVP